MKSDKLHIKKEIRVLGIAAQISFFEFIIVGIVFRGNMWLDGVLKGRSSDIDLTNAISNTVKKSSHIGQIRVILLSRNNLPPGSIVDLYKLSVETNKPVIFIGEPLDDSKATFTWGKRDGGSPVIAVGLSRLTAERVLRVSTRNDFFPEALRVAAITISSLLADENT